ncbi:MAG: methylenetetrahydrofolate reductase [NAD(P)H] [Lysobacterales bacterium]|jgi:methylenetetrahydrofolate reductase (NADPH)
MVKSKVPISFEFFPPRNDAQRKTLATTWERLSRLNPRYLSVTFGAGGSSVDATLQAVQDLLDKSGVPVAPHISCMAQDRDMLCSLLNSYLRAGVERIVVLRGDRPDGVATPGPFQYASDLVRFVQQEFPNEFHIEVACYPEFHPESPNPESEFKYFKEKVDAGADGATTQYFYNTDCYFQFLDDCERHGIDIPITPGIMPITNYKGLEKFSAMCGAEIPRWMRKRLHAFGDDDGSVREFGLEVVTKLCERLILGGAPGLHIYTLNRANATMRLWQRLNYL